MVTAVESYSYRVGAGGNRIIYPGLLEIIGELIIYINKFSFNCRMMIDAMVRAVRPGDG